MPLIHRCLDREGTHQIPRNSQGSEVAKKENELSENIPKHIDICDITDTEFKIAVLKIIDDI